MPETIVIAVPKITLEAQAVIGLELPLYYRKGNKLNDFKLLIRFTFDLQMYLGKLIIFDYP